jgi:hypothetical protein
MLMRLLSVSACLILAYWAFNERAETTGRQSEHFRQISLLPRYSVVCIGSPSDHDRDDCSTFLSASAVRVVLFDALGATTAPWADFGQFKVLYINDRRGCGPVDEKNWNSAPFAPQITFGSAFVGKNAVMHTPRGEKIVNGSFIILTRCSLNLRIAAEIEQFCGTFGVRCDLGFWHSIFTQLAYLASGRQRRSG